MELNIKKEEDMPKKTLVLMPKTRKKLEQLGYRISMARLRRDLSVELVAERAGISRTTLWAIERGSPTVSIGAYAKVLAAIQMGDEIDKICADDPLGIFLQEEKLAVRKRAGKK